jgi:hypothetical protein
MSKRAAAQAEARFMRGQTGVDGQSETPEVDPDLVEQAKAKEALLRGRTWLGRECLTWWLYKSESTEPLTRLEKQAISLVFVGRVTLKAAAGEVTEVSLKGVAAPYAQLARRALSQGLLVHAARIKLTWGEQVFELGLDAEHFDVKAAKLPAVVDGDDSVAERLELVGRLCRALDACFAEFAAIRASPGWKNEVRALRRWLDETKQKIAVS